MKNKGCLAPRHSGLPQRTGAQPYPFKSQAEKLAVPEKP